MSVRVCAYMYLKDAFSAFRPECSTCALEFTEHVIYTIMEEQGDEARGNPLQWTAEEIEEEAEALTKVMYAYRCYATTARMVSAQERGEGEDEYCHGIPYV